MRKIFVVGGDINYISWIKNIELVNDLEQADIVMFTGGADVSPEFYGEVQGQFTMTNPMRDIREKKIFEESKDKLCLGVCRGSQLITSLSGGSLIQHVTGHTGCTHYFTTNKDEQYKSPSTHHQMMYPFDTKHEMIAWSSVHKSTMYLDGMDNEIKLPEGFLEPEIVWYPETNSLAIQSHPEFTDDPILHNYLNTLLDEKYEEVYGKETVEDEI